MWVMLCDNCNEPIQYDEDVPLITVTESCHDNDVTGEHVHGTQSHFCTRSCLAAWSMSYALDAGEA